MFKKIKEYFEMRKLRRDALTLLLINGAEIVTTAKDTINMLNDYVQKSTGMLDEADLTNIKEFTDKLSSVVKNPNFESKIFDTFHDTTKKTIKESNE